MKEPPKTFCPYSNSMLATSARTGLETPNTARISSDGQLGAVDAPSEGRKRSSVDEMEEEALRKLDGADTSMVRSGSEGGFTSRFFRIPP